MHATEVAPRKGSVQDMAGGTETKDVHTMPLAVDEKLRGDSLSLTQDEGDGPTEEERITLRHVSDKLPWSAFLVAVIELCERFTYYGLSGPFQNYVQRGYHTASGLPGALGEMRSLKVSGGVRPDKVSRKGYSGCQWPYTLLPILVSSLAGKNYDSQRRSY